MCIGLIWERCSVVLFELSLVCLRHVNGLPHRKCEPDQQFYKELVKIEKELTGKNSVLEHELIADAAMRGPLAGFEISKEKVEHHIKKYNYNEAISLLVHQALQN